MIEGLCGDSEIGHSRAELAATLKQLAPRWFLLRNAHAPIGAPLGR